MPTVATFIATYRSFVPHTVRAGQVRGLENHPRSERIMASTDLPALPALGRGGCASRLYNRTASETLATRRRKANPGNTAQAGNLIGLASLGFRENVEVHDIPSAKVAAFSVNSAPKRAACHHKRKAQNRVVKMEKMLPVLCCRQLRDPTTRRSIVYAPSCSNSQKAVVDLLPANHRGHPRVRRLPTSRLHQHAPFRRIAAVGR